MRWQMDKVVCYVDSINQMDFQKGELPPGVVAVQGMTEALGALKTAIAYGRHRQQG